MSSRKDELARAQFLARRKMDVFSGITKKEDVDDSRAKTETMESKTAKNNNQIATDVNVKQTLLSDDENDETNGNDEQGDHDENDDEEDEKEKYENRRRKRIKLEHHQGFNEEDELPLSQILAKRKRIIRSVVAKEAKAKAYSADTESEEEESVDDDDDDDDMSRDDDQLSDQEIVDDSTETENENEDQEDEVDESDDADDSQSDETPNNKRKRDTVRSSGRNKRRSTQVDQADEKKPRASPRGPLSGRTCPHCGKVFSIKLGMQYHIDHFVCRPAFNPNPETKKRGGRRKLAPGEEGKAKRKSPKIRGSKGNRTCPNCQRVFTSEHGLSYHVEHGVCEQKLQVPFVTLLPGSRFVTSFGVVEVVADNRAIPTASYPDNLKHLTRQWSSWKSKRDAQMNRVLATAAVRQRTRRYNLAASMSTNDSSHDNRTNARGLTQQAVWKIYFGGNPTLIPKSEWSAPSTLGPTRGDPMFPQDSYPDRIVECIQIPDQRKKFLGLDDNEWFGNDGNDTVSQDGPNRMGRLYLQRKLLTEPYKQEISVRCCPSCGVYFNSRPGIKFHIDSQVCKKAKARAQAAQKNLQEIEAIARRPPPSRRVPVKRAGKPKKKKEDSMYPQVWLSLGFHLLPNKTPTQLVYAPLKEEAPEEPPDMDVEEPDTVLRGLRATLQFVTMVQNVTLGPIYPEVFMSLGFIQPRKKRKRNDDGEEEDHTGELGRYRPRRKRRTLPKPPPPPKPLPPIIDVRALADEVDIGRYPSVKRYKGDDHQDKCFICHKVGTLYCCEFCTKAVHMECMLEKFTIKVPEPEDDFMCHRCIQYILQRRARAEKRRMRKQQLRDAMAVLPGEIPEDMKGMEYEYLASQGRDMSELLELIQDAQTRLRLALETENVNDIRRSFIESCERVGDDETAKNNHLHASEDTDQLWSEEV